MEVLLFGLLIIGIRCSSSTEKSSTSSSGSDATWKLIAFLLLSGILIMLSIIIYLMWKLFKLKSRIERNVESVTPSNNENRSSSHILIGSKRPTKNLENETEWGLIASCSDDLDLESKFEIDARNLELKDVIEEGYFSKVQKGTLKMAKPRNMKEKGKRLDVIVKGAINQQDSTQQRMILDELKVMCEISKHPNLLALVGYVVNSNQMLIVSESVDQNLLKFLKDRRGMFETNNSESSDSIKNVDEQNGFYNVDYPEISEEFEPISFVDLLAFAYQIANGMRHLTSMSYVHRQLALRNVYISHDQTIRIGELGLARRHGNNEYYRIMNKEVPLGFPRGRSIRPPARPPSAPARLPAR